MENADTKKDLSIVENKVKTKKSGIHHHHQASHRIKPLSTKTINGNMALNVTVITLKNIKTTVQN